MAVNRSEHQAAFETFMAAISRGDVQGRMDVLAPDVVMVADGGLVEAVRRPIHGARKVATRSTRWPSCGAELVGRLTGPLHGVVRG